MKQGARRGSDKGAQGKTRPMMSPMASGMMSRPERKTMTGMMKTGRKSGKK